MLLPKVALDSPELVVGSTQRQIQARDSVRADFLQEESLTAGRNMRPSFGCPCLVLLLACDGHRKLPCARIIGSRRSLQRPVDGRSIVLPYAVIVLCRVELIHLPPWLCAGGKRIGGIAFETRSLIRARRRLTLLRLQLGAQLA